MYEPSAGRHFLSEGFSLEKMWQDHEAALPTALDQIETRPDALEASTWCETLVPFVTSLLVRTPEFLARYQARVGDIEINDRDNALASAVTEMSRMLSPVMTARWTLLRAPDSEPFITTDRGWFASQFNGTGDPGLIVPISPGYALVIEPRYRRQIAVATHGAWTAPVDAVDVGAGQMQLMRRWAANFALMEVYGSDDTVVGDLRNDIGYEWFADPWMLGFLDGRRLVPTELDWWRAACTFRRPPGQAGFRPPDAPPAAVMAELPASFPLMQSIELPPTSGLEIGDAAVAQHLFLEAFMIAPEGMESVDVLRNAGELDQIATAYGPARLREAAWLFRCFQQIRSGNVSPVELPPWLRSVPLPPSKAVPRSKYAERAEQVRAAAASQRSRGEPRQQGSVGRSWTDVVTEQRERGR
jgi:hypothetical protein